MSYQDKSGKSGLSHAPKRVQKYCWAIRATIDMESGVCQQAGCTTRGQEGCMEIVRR